jgi:hypothetical protein
VFEYAGAFGENKMEGKNKKITGDYFASFDLANNLCTYWHPRQRITK